MAQRQEYEAIVVGAGQGGVPLAMAFARHGRSTALVEAAHVGGTCVNEGCTPTKTMVASARVAHLAHRAADYGVRTGDLSIDLERVRKRKRDIVDMFRSGSERRVEETENLELIRGRAAFTGPRRLEVTSAGGGRRELVAETVVINTGARPAVPPIEGIRNVPFLDSTGIMELAEVPDHLVIIGGGYVGVEFGQMLTRFGSRVTIVQRSGQLLPREDADVAEAVLDILRQDGVEVLLGSETRSVGRDGDGRLVMRVSGWDGDSELVGSHLLLAAGRTPQTKGLGLERAGVEINGRGFVRVDDRLRTSAAGVYALGDVKGGPAFTHISYDDYRILEKTLLLGEDASTSGRFVPYVVFMDPQLGRVGMSEKEASAAGIDFMVAKMPMGYAARALEVDETRGLMKALVDRKTGKILGCAILGVEGGEIMSAVQIAMMGGLPYTALRDGTFAHPTLAESLNTLFGSISD